MKRFFFYLSQRSILLSIVVLALLLVGGISYPTLMAMLNSTPMATSTPTATSTSSTTTQVITETPSAILSPTSANTPDVEATQTALAGLVAEGVFGTQTAEATKGTPTSTSAATMTPPSTVTPTATPKPAPISLPGTLTDAWDVPLVLVPAGAFEMGSENGDSDEQPVHTVTLDGFYIDQYEVSNAQYADFLNEVGNQNEGGGLRFDANDSKVHIHPRDGVWQADNGYADYPVTEVTWYGARAYCLWREARLPTEAEWEKAARGTDGRTYPWGEQSPDSLSLSKGEITPVGSHPDDVSPYGIYDMASNVAEWVADWYDPGYYLNSSPENPSGPPSGEHRVVRGYTKYHTSLRATERFRLVPTDAHFGGIGFRCARSVDAPQTPIAASSPSIGNEVIHEAPFGLQMQNLGEQLSGAWVGPYGHSGGVVDRILRFRWNSNHTLEAKEYFELRIWEPDGPHWGGAPATKDRVAEVAIGVLTGRTELPTNRSDLRDATRLCASVAIITSDPYVSLSPESESICWDYQ